MDCRDLAEDALFFTRGQSVCAPNPEAPEARSADRTLRQRDGLKGQALAMSL
jgi:hypothetical protein